MKKSFIINRDKENNAPEINLNFDLPRGIKSKVLDYQVEHIKHLVYVLLKNRVCLDASDTGTGKTYCALGAAKAIGCRPFIICPKPVITSWANVCKHFAIEPLAIINYDSLRNGTVHSEYIQKNEGKKEESYETNVKVISIAKKGKVSANNKLHYSWTLPSDSMLIFDEAHKCKNTDTLNSMLLQAAISIPNKVLMLSATIVDKPDNFAVFGYLLGLSSSLSNMRRFIASYSNEASLSAKLHNLIFPVHGGRIRIKDLGNKFPDNKIIPECFYMETVAKEINEKYLEIHKGLEDLKNKEIKDKSNILSKMLRARQRIEILKLPTIGKLIEDYLENNLSVVVFLNFNESLRILAEHFKTTSLIYGDQTGLARDKIIDNFQNNKTRLLICNAQSGGTGLSMHDLDGNYPRISLISPNWSSIIFTQILGRIHRAGAKSKAVQKIVFCGGTIEEKIAERVKCKLKNLSLINDGDLI